MTRVSSVSLMLNVASDSDMYLGLGLKTFSFITTQVASEDVLREASEIKIQRFSSSEFF